MKGNIARLFVIGVLAAAACGGGASKADGAAGGSAAAGTGGAAGAGGTANGGTGGGNADGGAVLTSCPTEEPITQPACTGTLYCTYQTACSCTGCCSAVYRCTDGRLTSSGLDYNDTCLQGRCRIGVVCGVGGPDSCNDDPDAGAVNGSCDAITGKCLCPPGRLNPDSGRCLAP